MLPAVGLAIAAIGLSIWLPYHREQQVIQKIEDWNGWVHTETSAPDWLRNLVGEDRTEGLKVFERIIFIDLRGTKVTDTELAHLSKLANPRSLNLDGTQVTDAGLVYLNRLTSLEQLNLRLTAVTPEGAAELQKALPNCNISY